MKSVLLIENRPERERQFLENSGAGSLSVYSFLKEITYEELNKLKLELLSNKVSSLSYFDLIMTHKSALSLLEQDTLSAIKKPLVFFSGGISQSFYSDIPSPVLHINDLDFYSNNLIDFFDNILYNDDIELLILQFGKKWKLNLLLSLRDELSQKLFNELNEGIIAEDFDNLFNEKVMTLNWSDETIKIIELAKTNGIAKNDNTLSGRIREAINEHIIREMGILK